MGIEMKNLLSIDLEDWYHFIGDPGVPSFEEWSGCESRVEEITDILLEIVDGLSITFFVLGFIADQHPGLIRRISSLGHEIACHGYRHDFVFAMGPGLFRQDIGRTKRLLEDLTGLPCLGYRAPGFSIRQQDLWALDIIREEGFVYDTSIFPAVRTAGGVAGFYPYPQVLPLKAGPLVELPISTSRLLGVTTAFCGGGFFRFFPGWYIHKNIGRINQLGHPAVVYIHPRDIDPQQPRMKLKLFNRFIYYYGLQGAKEKFTRLVKGFEWGGFGEFASGIKSSEVYSGELNIRETGTFR
jgi:polysaccharide deacetylase family protein (PEP-CTERM system associated)